MSYEMRSLRKEDANLHFYIKNVVLRDFVELDESVDLQLMPELCVLDSHVYEISTSSEPNPFAFGRGIVYFDEPEDTSNNCYPFTNVSGTNGDGDAAIGLPEQSNRLTLYNTTSSGLQPLHWSNYMIDYVDGRVVVSQKLTSPKVSYYWNYVSVVDEWPSIQASEPPVVVIEVHGTDKEGYQLGHGKLVIRQVDIHVFATNPSERNDLVEVIYDGLYNKSCPFINFSAGTVLDYDGTFYGRRDLADRTSDFSNKLTYLFDREEVLNVSRLQFRAVKARHVNLPLVMTTGVDETMLSDLNAYRSKISFEMFYYDDRTI